MSLANHTLVRSALAASCASCLLVASVTGPAAAQSLSVAPDFDARGLASVLAAIDAQVRREAFPGAAVAIGHRGHVALEQGVGRVAWGAERVDAARTRYDLASLTKVVATTTAAMLLVDDGRLLLDAPVARYLPEFVGGRKGAVTVRHLLAHSAGLPAGAGGRTLDRLLATSLARAPGSRPLYSDLSMVVLWAAAERAAGESLTELLRRRVWEPLGMGATGFTPGAGCAACAPTGRGALWRGVVHDPIARRLGGVAGNAGLFSTAHDLGRFAAMLAGGGALDGVRVVRPETVRLFAERQPGGSRALGWDTRGGALWHTGYTGTSLWIDPDRGTWAVLLTNRTYQPHTPYAQARVGFVRRLLRRWAERAAVA